MGVCEKVVKECAKWVKPREEVVDVAQPLPCERDVRHEIRQARRDRDVADLDRKYQRLDMRFLRWSVDRAPFERIACIVGMVLTAAVLVVPPIVALASWDPRPLTVMMLAIMGAIPVLFWFIEPDAVQVQHIPQFACFDAFGDGRCVYGMWEGKIAEVEPYLPNLGGKTYSCVMTGAIPEEAREKIREAREDFDCVIIVAEMSPSAWTIKRADPDPLIVGHKNGAFWLVSWFELTKMEDYVLGTQTR